MKKFFLITMASERSCFDLKTPDTASGLFHFSESANKLISIDVDSMTTDQKLKLLQLSLNYVLPKLRSTEMTETKSSNSFPFLSSSIFRAFPSPLLPTQK